MKRKSFLPLRFITLLTLLIFLQKDINAQFFDRLSNPQVTVSLTHPPGFGIKVNKVAFGPQQAAVLTKLLMP